YSIQSQNAATGQKIFLTVGTMGDKSGHASTVLRDRMRSYVVSQLHETSYVTLQGSAARARGFIIDGAIKSLSVHPSGSFVEATCEVELLISIYPTHSIVMMTSGEASVQEGKMQFRPQHEQSMEIDALENAVKGAHQNLLQFLEA